jgi:hypothetical protein
METIEVQFRKLRGEIIAVFPYVIMNKTNVLSYQHIGQHSECIWNINSVSKAAKPEEYRDLLSELRGIYLPEIDFKVIKKRNHKKYLEQYYKSLRGVI